MHIRCGRHNRLTRWTPTGMVDTAFTVTAISTYTYAREIQIIITKFNILYIIDFCQLMALCIQAFFLCFFRSYIFYIYILFLYVAIHGFLVIHVTCKAPTKQKDQLLID